MTTLAEVRPDVLPVTVHSTPGGGAIDPTCTVIGFAALRLTSADPRRVPSRQAVAALLGRFGRLLEIVAQPGRGVAAVDLAADATGTGLAAHLLVGVAAPDDAGARREARAAARAVGVVLTSAPAVWAFEPCDPELVLSVSAVAGVRVVQRSVTVDDGQDQATAVSRFERSADPDDSILRLLLDNDARLRVSVLSTSLGIDDHRALDRAAQAAKRIAERAGDSPLGLRARRVAATIADSAESLHTPVFCVDVTVASATPLAEATVRAMAGQLTTELDVIHRGERIDLASPTVAGRPRLVGGYELRPLSAVEVKQHLNSGLPVPGGHNSRGLKDLVSLTEAAALCRWPLPAGSPLPGLPAHGATRPLPAPAVTDGVPVGTDGSSRPVRIRVVEPSGHVHVVGDTGAGKTTFMAAMIDQLAEDGVKVIVVDPHRSLAAHAAAALRRHGRNAAVLNAADPATTAISAIHPATPEHHDGLDADVARIVDAIVSMWNAEWSGPRFRDMADAALRALAHINGAHPFAHVSELLSQTAVARLDRVDVPKEVVQSLHRAVHSNDTADLVSWFCSKFSILGRGAAVRRLIAPVGQGVTAERLIADYDGVIVSIGDDALSRDQSALLGHLLLSLLIDAAMARPTHEQQPVVIFVDEAHRYACDALERVLVEGRKFALSIVAAHQHLSQLPRHLNDALAGNAATLVAFRAGADGAAVGARLSLAPDDLQGLPDLAGFARVHDATGRRVTTSLQLKPPASPPPLVAAGHRSAHVPAPLLELLPSGIKRPESGSAFLDAWLDKRKAQQAAPASDLALEETLDEWPPV